jgi:hypothetical protein
VDSVGRRKKDECRMMKAAEARAEGEELKSKVQGPKS